MRTFFGSVSIAAPKYGNEVWKHLDAPGQAKALLIRGFVPIQHRPARRFGESRRRGRYGMDIARIWSADAVLLVWISSRDDRAIRLGNTIQVHDLYAFDVPFGSKPRGSALQPSSRSLTISTGRVYKASCPRRRSDWQAAEAWLTRFHRPGRFAEEFFRRACFAHPPRK